MKININSIDDWEELDELPIKQKIVKKKKKDRAKENENSKEIDNYDKDPEEEK